MAVNGYLLLAICYLCWPFTDTGQIISAVCMYHWSLLQYKIRSYKLHSYLPLAGDKAKSGVRGSHSPVAHGIKRTSSLDNCSIANVYLAGEWPKDPQSLCDKSTQVCTSLYFGVKLILLEMNVP